MLSLLLGSGDNILVMSINPSITLNYMTPEEYAKANIVL
jgi:hypothetical protein